MNIPLPPSSQQRRLRDLWGMRFAETCPVESISLSTSWNAGMACRGLLGSILERTRHLQVEGMNV